VRLEVLFGDPRINVCMQLPEAYRSLPRPSSALKPSHPSHSVVTSKPGPTAGVGAYTRRHRLTGLAAPVGFTLHPRHFSRELHQCDCEWSSRCFLASVFLGGDPAAGSPTATLLRLNPPYEAQVRHGQHSTMPHLNLIRVVRRAVCARSRDVFTAG
jgi:hypothetical protein